MGLERSVRHHVGVGIEPGPLEEQPVAFPAEPSLQPCVSLLTILEDAQVKMVVQESTSDTHRLSYVLYTEPQVVRETSSDDKERKSLPCE